MKRSGLIKWKKNRGSDPKNVLKILKQKRAKSLLQFLGK